MVWLKACPRCKGDLFLDEDHYGKFKSCVQCGYTRDLVERLLETIQHPSLAASDEEARTELIAAGAAGD